MTQTTKTSFSSAAQPLSPSRVSRSSLSPVTLRLTADERARLEELANGMTLSAYIRACVFAKEDRRRKRRSASVVADKKAIAEALALLGQSRIANNLNQLAYHANIGALAMDEADKAELAEAYAHVRTIRSLLLTALGKNSTSSGDTATDIAASRSARTRYQSKNGSPQNQRRGT